MNRLSACLALVCVLSMGVSHCSRDDKELPVTADSISTPFQEFDKATLLSYQGSHVKWRLKSMYMRKALSDTGTILASPVVLSLYDSTGATRTRILADSGLTTAQMESFEIWGDAYVKTHDGLVVRSERLELDNESRQWFSDSIVVITTAKGDRMQGKGFTASESFSRSSFRERVRAKFPNFKERVEQDDDFFQ